jgi:hypothetical protein
MADPERARDPVATGLMRFLDIRAVAIVLAFVFVMWLVTGLEETDVPARTHIAEACVRILLWQAAAIVLVGFLGEWLPRTAVVLFVVILIVGLVRVALVPGPLLYGPDLVLAFNAVMAVLIYKTAGRYFAKRGD